MTPVQVVVRKIRHTLRFVRESRWRDWWTNRRLPNISASIVGSGECTYETGRKLRVFVAVHHVNWEQQALVESWKKIAHVHHFEWGKEFDQYDNSWFMQGRPVFQERLFSEVEEAHHEEPINLFFSYLSARWVERQTIERIGALGIPTANFSFDDARLFWGPKIRGYWTGVAPIASAFNLNVTVARPIDTFKYTSRGARAIFLPPAGNADTFAIKNDVPVNRTRLTFVGQRYGHREEFIKMLQGAGLPIEVFGLGWSAGSVSHEEKMHIYKESLVTIGFGFLGESFSVSMKGRDFEVPMTGACYITTFEPTLAKMFVPDREMVFYSTKNELKERIEYLLDNPEIALSIGAAGRKKALEEHQWHMRWSRLLKEMNIAPSGQ